MNIQEKKINESYHSALIRLIESEKVVCPTRPLLDLYRKVSAVVSPGLHDARPTGGTNLYE
jgi:hypothetical protein